MDCSIKDVIITPLKQIENEKGDIFHVMKSSDTNFKSFGEVYLTHIKYNCYKGWKRHKRMTVNLVVPVGEVLFILYDQTENKYCEITLSKNNYVRLTIPPGIWFAFKGVSNITNLIINVASIEHDSIESETCDLKTFNYFGA